MGRQRCSGCERPVCVCLCGELPSTPLATRTSVVVLQHPHEARHKLSTLPILSKCLANCHILCGRRFQAGACPLLDFFFSRSHSHSHSHSHALLLFPTPSAQPIAAWYTQAMHPSQEPSDASSSMLPSHSAAICRPSMNLELGAVHCITDDSMQIVKGPLSDPLETTTTDLNSYDVHPCSQQRATGFPPIVLIAVDATWQHANEMIKASAPFLDKFVVPVCLPFDATQEGLCMANSKFIIRKEPFKGCMTTLEAISGCLKILEPDGVEIHGKLLHVLRCMVQCQASNIAAHKVRLNKQNRSTANHPGESPLH